MSKTTNGTCFIQFNRWFARETRQGTSSSRGQAVGVMVNGKVDFLIVTGATQEVCAKGLPKVLKVSYTDQSFLINYLSCLSSLSICTRSILQAQRQTVWRRQRERWNRAQSCYVLDCPLDFPLANLLLLVYTVFCCCQPGFVFGRRTRATRQGSSRETTLAAQVWPE